MSKLDYPRRSAGLFRRVDTPNPPAGQPTTAGAFHPDWVEVPGERMSMPDGRVSVAFEATKKITPAKVKKPIAPKKTKPMKPTVKKRRKA